MKNARSTNKPHASEKKDKASFKNKRANWATSKGPTKEFNKQNINGKKEVIFYPNISGIPFF